jgi:hypothetical protein
VLFTVAALASFSFGQSGTGTLTYTETAQSQSDCDGAETGYTYTFVWTYTDASGGQHAFAGDTQTYDLWALIGVLEHNHIVYECEYSSISTSLGEWSTDGLYYLQATGSTGSVSSMFDPAYKVISILYSPPGNQSFQGYTDTTTDGTTTTIGNSFTFSYEVTFSTGMANIFDVGGSTGYSVTTSNSSAFTQTFSDATSVSSDDNSNSTYNPLKSDAINHNLDTFVIWLNPQVILMSEGTNLATAVSYTLSSQPTPGVSALVADTVMVPAIAMEPVPGSVTNANPAGVTSVPLPVLEQQPIAGANGNSYMPGLAAICKNHTYYPNNCSADPNGQCGCVPSDFAGILATDPLLNYPAQPYAGTVYPLEADSLPSTSGPGSGPTVCGENPIPANSNCRYVIVPIGTGSTTPEIQQLTGGGKNQFQQSDSTTSTLTTGSSFSDNVGVTLQVGPLLFQEKQQLTWTWTDMESTGNSTSEGNTMTVMFQTLTTDCDENVSIFEDTVYHTFAFQVPTGANGCNPAAQPVFSPVGGAYSTPQTVTISDATSGATIYYTTDGTTPTTSSPVYTGPITVSSTETIQAIATAPGYETSILWSAAYIEPPNFYFTATPTSQTIGIGAATTFTVTTTALDGFSGIVDLNVTGLPSNTTASFSPGTITGSGSSTLTITTTGNTPLGTYPLTLTGTSGTLTGTASVTLVVAAAGTWTFEQGVRLTNCAAGSTSCTLTIANPQGGVGDALAVFYGSGTLGKVNTTPGSSGSCPANCVSWVSGQIFTFSGGMIFVGSTVPYTIGTVYSTTLLSLTTNPGTKTDVDYMVANPITSANLGSANATLVPSSGCFTLAGSNIATDCAYFLSPPSSGTSLVVNLGYAPAADWYVGAVECESSGTAYYDTAGASVFTTNTASPTGPSLTLSGANDCIVNGIRPGQKPTGISLPYMDAFSTFDADLDTAYSLNTASGTGPTWTLSNAAIAATDAIAFKD